MSGKRLNYNKWDTLELSDDSDIEVDKKSMIRWKQRDIHEKREIRKLKIHHLGEEKKMNAALLIRMGELKSGLAKDGDAYLEREVGRLRSAVPDFEGKQFKDGEQPSQDHMVLSLLLQIGKAVKEGQGKKTAEGELDEHIKKLEDRQVDVDKERETEEAEQKKHITSDDLHMGWDSKTMISSQPSVIPQGPLPPVKPPTSKPKKTEKSTETVIETLNSPSTSTAISTSAAAPSDNSSDEESDAAPLSPSALAFSKLPSLDFPKCYGFISAHSDLLVEGTTDALLVEAFSAAMKNQDKRARECVEKGLMIQYCLQLGRDGVTLFFKRMTGADPRALQMFLEDVAKTSTHIINRAHVVAKEKAEKDAEGVEQIQLVASDPNMTITFEVPDGPPPETITIEGEGADELDPIQVREFLQKRWEIFDAFPKNLKKALVAKSLEDVNKVLGKMSIEDAEEVVQNLQDGGILSFESSEIRDETGKSKEVPVDEEEEPNDVIIKDVPSEVD